MAAPTPTPTHSAQASTSPAPATATSTIASPDMFPPTAAYATFMHSVLSEMLHELKAVRKELQDIRRNQPNQTQTPSVNRKRKRPGPTAPCALCRMSRTPCIATHASEACQRCIRKQVECFDDSEGPDQPRVRHPPEDDGAEDYESEPEVESVPAPPAPVWQQPTPNGIPAGYPSAPNYPPTPVKRERVTKACADCHARKRKCTGGPNCGARQASSARTSPHKPAGSTPTSRAREPCAECRGRKRRCIHHADGTPNGANKSPEEQDEIEHMDDVPPTDTEPEPERERPVVEPSPSHSHSRSPPPGRWHYPPGPPPPPHWGYPEQHRGGAPPYHGHPHHPHAGSFMHDRPPYGHPHAHPHPHPHGHPGHPPPPHPHGLHPHPHPHARLPPAPDMRHPGAAATTTTTDPNLPPSTAKSTTPAPVAPPAPPAGRKGRACLACRKLKMRCVAPNEEGGPDERCQRCERAGLECVYVDRKRRGPGGVFTGQEGTNGTYKDATPGFATQPENQTPVFGDERSAKKLKREGSPSSYANGAAPNPNGVRREEDGMRTQQDAARALEESFADEEGSER